MKNLCCKILLLCFFLTIIPNKANAEVTLTKPFMGETLTSKKIYFEWENTDTSQEYVYKLHYSLLPNLSTAISCYDIRDTYIDDIYVPDVSYLYWRIFYHPLSTFNGTYDYKTDISVFGVNVVVPEDIIQMVLKTHQIEDAESKEEIEEEDEKEVEEIVEVGSKKKKEKEVKTEKLQRREERIIDTQQDIPVVLGKKNSTEENERVDERGSEYEWNIVSSKKGNDSDKDLGGRCKFKYIKGESKLEYCNIPKTDILEESKYCFFKEWAVVVKGKVIRDIEVEVDEYICEFKLLNPSTWFKCKEKFVKKHILNISPNIFFTMYNNGNQVPIRSFNLEGKDFTLLAGYFLKQNNLELEYLCRIVNSRFNIFYDYKERYQLNPLDESILAESNKPFSFPFERIIGVTQWYGNTTYQTPHTGIDFGAREEIILAVADGEVIGKGWDNYYGDCLSGGFFIKVKQSNGMYTVYFHLKDIYVNTGELVKKGQHIGRSGNSGAWNCQKLGYHLHFETRLNSSMHSHSNPVNYISINWNEVPTLGYLQNPGRLTGQNPHPGR